MTGPYHVPYVTEGDVSLVSSTQKHELGTQRWNNGRILEYVKFTQNLQRYNWVGRSTSDATSARGKTAAMLITSSTHSPVGVAEYGGTANSYGWITRFGPATAKTGTAAQGEALFNDAQATGTLALGNYTSATAMLTALSGKSGGVMCGDSSATGTIVDVNCL